ncbi:hypothetical protein FACS1894152_5450 [Bacilli bacterium]|nr:hypothetical protein FACS1894152_5450 [Bacilli bacterium]
MIIPTSLASGPGSGETLHSDQTSAMNSLVFFLAYSVILLRIYADTAMTTKTSSDYTVMQIWGRDEYSNNSNHYLVDQIRGKWDADELLMRAQAFYQKASNLQKGLICNAFCVEAKANGIVLLQQLRKRKIPVIELEANKDKIMRAQDALPTIASGFVYLPKEAEFLSDYLREIEAFPAGVHDDVVDSTIYALNDRELTLDLADTL